MRLSPGSWFLLLLFLSCLRPGLFLTTTVKMQRYRRTRLDKNVWTASDLTDKEGIRSLIACAGVCKQHNTCEAFDYDAASLKCQLGPWLEEDLQGDHVVHMVPAPSSCGVDPTATGAEMSEAKAKYALEDQYQGLSCTTYTVHTQYDPPEPGYNLWEAPDGLSGADAYLEMDLGCVRQVDGVRVRNLMWNNKSTKEYSVHVALTPGTWTQVLTGSLTDDRGKNCDQVLLVGLSFPKTVEKQYVRFQVESFYGLGGGLQFIEVMP